MDYKKIDPDYDCANTDNRFGNLSEEEQKFFNELTKTKLEPSKQTYIILIDYRTGNSFNTEEKYGEELESFSWENLDIAKENLQRIKEHYKYYTDFEYYNKTRHLYKHLKKPIPPKWWIKNSTSWNRGLEHCSINLKLDNGKEVHFTPFWIGYFEDLYGAEIKIKNEDLKFTL